MIRDDSSEQEIIQIRKVFRFLIEEGYRESEAIIGGKEPSVSFENNSLNRKIRVYWSEAGYYDVEISRKKMFSFGKYSALFSVIEVWKTFENEYWPPFGIENKLNYLANFIKTNFTPIVKGKKWLTNPSKPLIK